MKNIHILPTDQPSRLKQNMITKKLSVVNKGIDLTAYIPMNIYITFSEEIEEGNWRYDLKCNEIFKTSKSDIECYDTLNCKKIILTTDPTLIADGVQSIDDNFLEWFIKNPSCDFIDIGLTENEYSEWLKNGGQLYKIIIPHLENYKFT